MPQTSVSWRIIPTVCLCLTLPAAGLIVFASVHFSVVELLFSGSVLSWPWYQGKDGPIEQGVSPPFHSNFGGE